MRFQDSFSDLSSIGYEKDKVEKLELPTVFSSDEDARRQHRSKQNNNRFSKAVFGTPEVARGEKKTSRRERSLSPIGRRELGFEDSIHGDDSLEKITDKYDNKPFVIPPQFRGDPEFMRSINYGKPKTSSLSNDQPIKLPDISTFSEFEAKNKRPSKKSQRIPVSSIPTDPTSRAIHSIFGSYMANAQDLERMKQTLVDKDVRLRKLERALNQNSNVSKWEKPHDEELKASNAKGSDTEYNDRKVRVGRHDSETKIKTELESLKQRLLLLEDERDYYKRLAQISRSDETEPSGYSKHSAEVPSTTGLAPIPKAEHPQWSAEAEVNKVNQRLNTQVTDRINGGIFSSDPTPPTAHKYADSKMGDTHLADNTPLNDANLATNLFKALNTRLAKSNTIRRDHLRAQSQRVSRADLLNRDACDDECAAANRTIRPTTSPQEAAVNLYNDLKAVYDENYKELTRYVEEYGQTDPAHERSKRGELQRKLISTSKKVEHDANLIYMLNDIALATELRLPSYERSVEE